MKKYFWDFGALLLVAYISCVTANYCNPGLCKDGIVHTACGSTEQNDPACGRDVTNLKFKPKHINLVLDEINFYRNKTAGGDRNFPKAARMPVMVWNNELAKLAAIHARRCNMVHDKCRNTKRFRYSGQNIFQVISSEKQKEDDVIKKSMSKWYEEINDVQLPYLESYPAERTSKPIGHYTVMVTDRATAIGCGYTAWIADKLHNVIFVCNFASTNMIGNPVYKPSETAGSECRNRDPKYTQCCRSDEPIDPNDVKPVTPK